MVVLCCSIDLWRWRRAAFLALRRRIASQGILQADCAAASDLGHINAMRAGSAQVRALDQTSVSSTHSVVGADRHPADGNGLASFGY